VPSLNINYNANDNPTIDDFHRDDSFIRAILGPVGSGKSVGCSVEILVRALAQKPDAQGDRCTRFAVVRNTYRELADTTEATFFEWIKPEWGIWRSSEHHFAMDIPLLDGTRLKCSVLFRALDTPKDLRKLLSLELTGAWLNEAREISWGVIDLLQTRVGRYPAMKDGGPSWFGIWMDTNAPDNDSKFYKIFEEIKPEGYKLFRQPSGLADNAENIQNLIPEYYSRLISGKSPEWIGVYVESQYGFVSDGKPVFPEYHDATHYSNEDYTPEPGSTAYVGIDFGLTPAATFGQQTASGQWVIFDELVTEDMGAANFAKLLNQRINHKYRDITLEIYGDPAGDQRAQTDEKTPFQVLIANGIEALPAPTNDFTIRRESIAAALGRLDFAGNPGFKLTRKARMLRKSLMGGYCYRRIMVSGGDRFQDKPDKGKYSHVNDSLQYLMCGAGEGQKLITNKTWSDELDYSSFDAMVV
jgi:hypothetical protein